MRRVAYAATACLVFAATACGSVDVTKALALTDVKTGWYDAGILEDGKNKLVPSISFKLTVKADQPISTVQVNAIFRRANEPEAWGEHFIKAIGATPVAPGQSTGLIVARSYLGYTGEQPRQVMLRHTDFVDAKVDVFVKYGSQAWVRLGEYPIARQLLTQ